MPRKPFLQFAVNDHLSDVGLRSCHPFARAVWVDMLCLMAQGEPYGHLRLEPHGGRQTAKKGADSRARGQARAAAGGTPSGTPHAPANGIPDGLAAGGAHTAYTVPVNGSLEFLLARISGVSEEEAAWSLAHLEEHNVYSRTPDGIIYSRRMVRDHAAHSARVERARTAYNRRQKKNQRKAKTETDGTADGAADGGASGTPSGTAHGRARAPASGTPHGPVRSRSIGSNKNPPNPPSPKRKGEPTQSRRKAKTSGVASAAAARIAKRQQ